MDAAVLSGKREKHMQTTLDRPSARSPIVNEADAQQAASAYVAAQLDPTFTVVEGAQYYSKPLQGDIWRFAVRCAQGPVGIIRVAAQTGTVIPLTVAELRTQREKAAILLARQHGRLPVDAQGDVVAEYARRQASDYLGAQLSLFYGGADPTFVPGEPPVWQVTIVFKMYDQGPFTLGMIDINAKTGEPIPLSPNQIERIRERACAIIRPQPSTTATG